MFLYSRKSELDAFAGKVLWSLVMDILITSHDYTAKLQTLYFITIPPRLNFVYYNTYSFHFSWRICEENYIQNHSWPFYIFLPFLHSF